MYQELKPSSELHHAIDSFWTFSNNHAIEKFKVLPDTCADLIFDLNHNQVFISGVMSSFQLRTLEIESSLIGMRIKAENFGSISKIPLNEIKNLRVELSEILPSLSEHRLKRIHDLDTVIDKRYFLENFIVETFKKNYEKQDKVVLSVAENIRLARGNISVKDLATSKHISLRQLERRFKKYIGLTIKEFSSIVRFNHAKKAIASFSKTSLLEIAFDMGFFDHSHMNYEFNRISGENPSFFR